MRKLYTLLFALFAALIFFEPVQVKASHVMGSDITWKCIGKDSFIVTVTAYRNCKGIELSATPITFKSACGGQNVNAGGEMSGGQDITPVCKKSCTQCKSTGCEFNFGIQQFEISALVDLSKIDCCEFTIAWEQSARNADITTGAAGQNFYSEVKLNKCVSPCDNSPYFTNPPIAIYCINQCVVINPGVNDIDVDFNGAADSLVYKFVQPMSAAGTDIPFNEGYSKEAPLKFAGSSKDAPFDPPKCNGFHLDPETGDIEFKAVQEDITVMAIGVEEWRKDSTGKPIKIGEIRRDLQIAIIECPDNRSPIISGINGGSATTMEFCAGQYKCFTINTFDVDDKDTVSLSSNAEKVIKGSTWDVPPGKRFPKGTFCWQPSNADVRSYPYRFVVTATDDACPVNGRASKSFGIKVNASPEATYSATIGNCGLVTFKAFPGKITAISKYEWSGSLGKDFGFFKSAGNPITQKYPKPGTYTYNLTVTSVNGCKTVYTDSVKIPDYVWLKLPNDTSVCINSRMSLQVQRFLGKADYLYNWSTDKKVNGQTVWTKDRTKIDSLIISKDTVFWVRVKDATGCENSDTIRIHAQVPPKPNLGPDRRECSIAGQLIELNAHKGLPKQKSFQWFKVDKSQAGGNTFLKKDTTGRISIKDSGTYWVLVTDTVGCTGIDTINMYFNPPIDAKRQVLKACHKDIVTMEGGTTTDSSAQWKWIDLRYAHLGLVKWSTRVVSDVALGSTTGAQPFVISYQVTVTQTLNGLTCKDVDTVVLRIYQKPKVKAGKLSPQCIDNGEYNLNQIISDPNGGVWSYPANNAAFTSTNVVSPRLLGVGKHYLRYTYTDPNTGCTSYDTSLLVVDTLPAVFAGRDTFICMENGSMLLSQINNLNPQQGGNWLQLDGKGLSNGLNPSFDPATSKAGTFRLVYRYQNKSSARCDNEDTVNITVYPTLVVDAGEYDPQCSIEEDLTLDKASPKGSGIYEGEASAMTALTYDAASGSYHFSPKKAGPGTYKLWYIGSHPQGRCPQTDTTYITVNPAPPVDLTVPGNKTRYCITDGLVPLQGTPAGGNYNITKGNQAAMVGTSFDPNRGGVGFYTIRYSYTDATTGCSNFKTIDLEVTDTPWVQIRPSDKLCRGNSYDMHVDTLHVNNSFVWRRVNAAGELEPGDFQPNDYSTDVKYTPTLDEEVDGDFTLAVVSNNTKTVCPQAQSTQTFQISPTPNAAFTLSPDKGCGPLGVTFTNQSDVNGEEEDIVLSVWDFGDGTIDTVNQKQVLHYYNYKGVGNGLNKFTVKLTVYSKAGCPATITKVDTVEVFVTPVPRFRAKPTYTTMNSPKIEFFNESDPSTVDESTIWEWNFGDPYLSDGGTSKEKNASHLYRDTGKYTVSLKATNPKTGCDSMVIKENYIDIRPEIIVFIPNAFTPGGVGKVITGPAENNTFKAVVSAVSSYNMKVYNRWGQLMFETDRQDIGWDGKFQGKDAQMDVYIYVLKAQSLSGKEYKYTGSVTLMR